MDSYIAISIIAILYILTAIAFSIYLSFDSLLSNYFFWPLFSIVLITIKIFHLHRVSY